VHHVTWNGAQKSGGTAAAGVYFVRFSAAGHSVSKRLIIIR
jgi:hypothetical protein